MIRSTRHRVARHRRNALRPFLNALEDRTLLSPYLVTNTADGGPGSLRDAINSVNNDSSNQYVGARGIDEIDFALPWDASDQVKHVYYQGSVGNVQPVPAGTTSDADLQPTAAPLWPHSWWSIQVGTELPSLTRPVFIDGYSQAGSQSNTQAVGDNAVLRMELNGSGGPFDGLSISADNSIVQGLVLNSFGGAGISITGADDIVQGCFIGTDPTGTRALPNTNGLWVGGTGSRVGSDGDGINDATERNIISGNRNPNNLITWANIGIIANGTGIVIAGNYIGTDVTGTKSLGNEIGVQITGPSRLGFDGMAAHPEAQRNLISGNARVGVVAYGGAVIAGNYIGTDVTGDSMFDASGAPIGNGWVYRTINAGEAAGIGVGDNVLVGTNADGTNDGAEANVISGNLNANVSFVGAGSVVAGNFIGTNKDGTFLIEPGGFGPYGVNFVPGSHDNLLGTDGKKGSHDGAERNIITGNGIDVIFGWTSSNNAVAGNFIGTFRDGVTGPPQPYGSGGVYLDGFNNRVGTNGDGIGDADEGNRISLTNSGVGVAGGLGNTIRGNSIVANGGPGIDLGRDGVTLNDSHSHTSGPNFWQNFPVLTAAYAGTSSTYVFGTLKSAPSKTFIIDFYSNLAPDGSGYGEGQTYLGSSTVTTNAVGDANIMVSGLAPISLGQWISATATAPDGSTSEFCQDVQVTQVTTTTMLTASANPSLLNQPITFTATVATPVTGLGTPTGAVQFVLDGANFGSPVPLSGSSASIGTSTLSIGQHTIQANYLGDSLFRSSFGGCFQFVEFRFGGFLPPLSTGISYALGRTIPIKFQLSDYNGNFVTGFPDATLVVEDDAGNLFNLAAAGGTGLRYDATANQYVFNWQTKGFLPGWYEINLWGYVYGLPQPVTIQLKAGGSSAGLLADTTGASTAATTGALLGGDLTIAVNDPNGLLTADEQARISDAIARIDQVLAPYGVTMIQIDPSSGPADVTIDTSSTSAVGGYADGVLGCESGTEVTLIQGWSWYAGADPTGIQAGQFDFETVVMHELGHVLGLGHSASATSVMYATLGVGVANRNLATADLNVPDADGGAPAGLHARISRPVPIPAAASPTPGPNVGLMAWDLAVADLYWSGINRTQRKRM